eukprot:gnl/TRDRNA2_/TRDRNA2_162744_c1_seq1.p1 gnl/TRDRNA2_/TRDRNA2_162744_c1~~gnl/TRDRNA2_/TRDRNA2_162744_c1_seq1.p1  ORF type:complete len:569 (+),score=89.75 gnl/TRDRNA2_/TRDRNA2_162744_c1_seq1:254-1960(+)
MWLTPIEEGNMTLQKKRVNICDTLDVTTIAYFRSVLYEDAGSLSTDCEGQAQSKKRVCAMPLHERIVTMETGEVLSSGDASAASDYIIPEATATQVEECMERVSQILFKNLFLDEDAEKNSTQFSTDHDRERMRRIWAMRAETLLKNKVHFSATNVLKIADARTIVNRLVRLDRLPKANNLKGLRLLQQAWDEHDVSMHYASFYKVVGKMAFLMQLTVMLLTVLFTIILDELEKLSMSSERSEAQGMQGTQISSAQQRCREAIFALPIVAGLITAMLAYMNPMQRWRKLRRTAGDLQSTIWLYRTRVGSFSTSISASRTPEDVLVEALNQSRDLLGGTEKSEMDKVRRKHHHMFKHQQHTGSLTSSRPRYSWWGTVCCMPGFFLTRHHSRKVHPELGMDDMLDDHHSPCNPEYYIRLRLVPMKEFFQERLPLYNRWRTILHIVTLACAAVATFLAYFSHNAMVAAVSALSAAVISWSEFTDVDRKLERYAMVVRSAKKLMSWWDSLSEVDHSSGANINRLVTEGEAIINGELHVWSSAGESNNQAEAAQEEDSGKKSASKMAGKVHQK